MECDGDEDIRHSRKRLLAITAGTEYHDAESLNVPIDPRDILMEDVPTFERLPTLDSMIKRARLTRPVSPLHGQFLLHEGKETQGIFHRITFPVYEQMLPFLQSQIKRKPSFIEKVNDFDRIFAKYTCLFSKHRLKNADDERIVTGFPTSSDLPMSDSIIRYGNNNTRRALNSAFTTNLYILTPPGLNDRVETPMGSRSIYEIFVEDSPTIEFSILWKSLEVEDAVYILNAAAFYIVDFNNKYSNVLSDDRLGDIDICVVDGDNYFDYSNDFGLLDDFYKI